jgi:hypothetical protein
VEPDNEESGSGAAPTSESAQSYLERLYDEIALRSASQRFAGSEVWDGDTS